MSQLIYCDSSLISYNNKRLMSHRNLDYLHRNRIVYRGYPENDEPTEIHWWGEYYKDGTYECYELFRSTAKITTFRSLKWHMSVLWWLNKIGA